MDTNVFDEYNLVSKILAKRTWLMSFHKKADKHRWDVNKYNSLKKVDFL